MTGSAQSPVVRLVLFMVCLSIAGAFVAGLHYYAVDQPQQKAVQAPGNTEAEDYWTCLRKHMDCTTEPGHSDEACKCIRMLCDPGSTPPEVEREIAKCYQKYPGSIWWL